jgi:hypothetical protein
MKVTAAFAAIAASAAFVSASPLRVIVVSNVIQNSDPIPFRNIRLGHAASAVNNPNAAHIIPVQGAPAAFLNRKPCAGARFRQKAIEVANSFRKTFGLPLIEPENHTGPTAHGGLIKISPIIGGPTYVNIEKGGPTNGWWGHTKGGDRVHIVTNGSQGGPPHHHHHAHPRPHRRPDGMIEHNGDTSFMYRLQLAIMSLGPWEGRAVAFVIGAGIGVLIRMFWVLAVVLFRGTKGDSNKQYSSVADEDEDDEPTHRGTPLSAPPTYVYPVDEKIVYDQEVPKAQPTGPN